MKEIIETINGKRHAWYERTVSYAHLYSMLSTGEGINELMQQFVRREDEVMFEQRKLITQHITRSVINNIRNIFNKIPRSTSMKKEIKGNESAVKKYKEIAAKFWGTDSLDKYVFTRWIELNFIDPNAFVVLEWKDFEADYEHAQPYPFEVKSKEAVNYKYVNKVLQWLVVEQKKEIEVNNLTGKSKAIQKTYTGYYPDRSIKFVQVFDEKIISQVVKPLELYRIEGRFYLKTKDDKDFCYEVIEAKPHNLGYVPAFRVGYERDQFSDGHVFVTPYDCAVPYFMKTIKTVSEMDLTMCLHAFPQKIQYVNPCPVVECEGGYVDGEVCKVCKGTGYKVHTSAQDVINMPLPPTKEDVMDLTNMIHYIYPPTELLKFQSEYIDKLVKEVKTTVFNSDIFTKSEVSETATGKNLDAQNVNETLYPMALAMAVTWENYNKTERDILSMQGLEFFMTFNKDFKLKTLEDLYRELEMVSHSNADTFIKQSIQDDIALILYSDNKEDHLKYKIKKKFYPFGGLTKEQLMYVLSSNHTSQFNKVLWVNFEDIFAGLEMDNKAFYTLNEAKQWELITEKVNEMIGNLQATPTLEL